LLIDCSTKNGEANKVEPRLKLELAHEEIAQMIGRSRENSYAVVCRPEEATDRDVQGFNAVDSEQDGVEVDSERFVVDRLPSRHAAYSSKRGGSHVVTATRSRRK
jgi:hypothetical protein